MEFFDQKRFFKELKKLNTSALETSLKEVGLCAPIPESLMAHIPVVKCFFSFMREGNENLTMEDILEVSEHLHELSGMTNARGLNITNAVGQLKTTKGVGRRRVL